MSNYNISYSLTLINPDTALPMIINVILFIIILYYWIFGSRSNLLSIYHLHLVLFLPEVLSYSSLDWLKLMDITNFFNTNRPYEILLFTGLTLMAEYMVLFMSNQFIEMKSDNIKRGALREEVEDVFVHQSTITFLLIILSLLTIAVTSQLVPHLQKWVHELLKTQEYRYILLGIISSIIVSGSLIIYFREHTMYLKGEESTPA